MLKQVLITGGTRGIGLALAESFQAQGASVAIVGRDPGRLAAVLSRHPDWQGFACDLASGHERKQLVARVTDQLQKLDGLVNCAGAGDAHDLTQAGPETASAIGAELEVNLNAPIDLTLQLLPTLRTRPSAAVLNVTSGFALCPAPAVPGYACSKAGLHAFTLSLRAHLENTGVHVMEILPPLVDTDMVARVASGKISPERVARETLRGLQRKKNHVYIGQVKGLWIGMRLLPALTRRILKHYPIAMR